MAKRKKKFKRVNGKGSVYELSGNRRNPWAVAVTIEWEKEPNARSKQIKKLLGTFETEPKATLILLRYNELSDMLLEKGFINEKIYNAFRDLLIANKNKEWETLINNLNYSNLLTLLVPQGSVLTGVSEGSTIGQLYDMIIKEAEKDNKAKKTISTLKSTYKSIEQLKDCALYNLTSVDFQYVVDDLIEDPEATSSFSKLNKIKSLVSQMYNILIKYKIMTVNHAQFISLRGVKEGKVPSFPESDINILFKNSDDRIAKSSLILAYTGLRIGEFLGLKKKQNIDLERMLIIGGSKTEAGKDRVIAIHEKIQPFIEFFYNEFPESEYLFSKEGEKVRYEYYREYYHTPLIARLNLTPLGAHSFRHTAASKMKIAKVDDKALIDMMGHTDIDFTNKKYIEVDYKFLHEEMKKVK